MIEEKNKIILLTVEKFFRRKAFQNIQKIFKKTHSADIADIIFHFLPEDGLTLFCLEDSKKKKAEILSHLPESRQKEFLEEIEKDELSKILSFMDSDDAVDLLSLMDEEESQQLLEKIKGTASQKISDLMGYPEDSAGAIMSLDFFSLSQNLTVKEAIGAIQADNGKSVIFYIYVINENQQLTGVLSLKQLILSPSDLKIKEIMISDVVVSRIDEDPQEVARRMEHYDFLSLPVVNETNKLIGIITIDDAMDVVREESKEDLLSMGQAGLNIHASLWEHFKGRFHWLLFSFSIGCICFSITSSFKELFQNQGLWVLTGFIPIMLTVGATAGGQTTTMGIAWIRTMGLSFQKLKPFFKIEILLSLIFGIVFFILNFIFLSYGFQKPFLVFSTALSLHIILSMFFGALLPVIIERMNLNPTLSSLPFFTAISNLSAIAILFNFIYSFSQNL